MKLAWALHPEHINVQIATSAAYQYRLQQHIDGKAELSVQHRGDRPSTKPIKRFTYKNRNAAFNGAQRFEYKHGYHEPEHHAPDSIVPFLPKLPQKVVNLLLSAQENARASARLAEDTDSGASQAFVDEQYGKYAELCSGVLCCEEYDCYTRTEIGDQWCAEHKIFYTVTED
jgi:hypothetical protein